MPYEDNQNTQDNTQSDVDNISSFESSEIQPSSSDNTPLTKDDMYYIANTLLEQMNIQQEQTNERFDAMEEELHNINASVSENSAQSALVVVEEQECSSVSANTVEKIKDSLIEFYAYSVSANTVSENEIMQKPLTEYSTSESLSLVLCLLVLCLLLYNVFIERR